MIKRIFKFLLFVLIAGFIWPQNFKSPVIGATKRSYDQRSFWFYPWGKSGTHKGVDIFAKEGTSVHPSTSGLVMFCGEFGIGGNVVLILGPKWRFHYYAHLNTIHAKEFSWVSKNDIIGTVGTTGNAQGKPPHLHYAIGTIIPYPWQCDFGPQGWLKMFYINPVDQLNDYFDAN